MPELRRVDAVVYEEFRFSAVERTERGFPGAVPPTVERALPKTPYPENKEGRTYLRAWAVNKKKTKKLVPLLTVFCFRPFFASVFCFCLVSSRRFTSRDVSPSSPPRFFWQASSAVDSSSGYDNGSVADSDAMATTANVPSPVISTVGNPIC